MRRPAYGDVKRGPRGAYISGKCGSSSRLCRRASAAAGRSPPAALEGETQRAPSLSGSEACIFFDATSRLTSARTAGAIADSSTGTFQVTPTTLQTISVYRRLDDDADRQLRRHPQQRRSSPQAAAWTRPRRHRCIDHRPFHHHRHLPPARGTTGGLVTITASVNGQTLTRQVFVQLTATQNGSSGTGGEQGQEPTDAGALSAGGGVGGVGGEGLGGPVTDPITIGALGSPGSDASAAGLSLLYPYDKTVWPRGMLAPLLMWAWATNDADAIQADHAQDHERLLLVHGAVRPPADPRLHRRPVHPLPHPAGRLGHGHQHRRRHHPRRRRRPAHDEPHRRKGWSPATAGLADVDRHRARAAHGAPSITTRTGRST